MDIKIRDSIKFCHYEDEVFYKGVKSYVILYYKVIYNQIQGWSDFCSVTGINFPWSLEYSSKKFLVFYSNGLCIEFENGLCI